MQRFDLNYSSENNPTCCNVITSRRRHRYKKPNKGDMDADQTNVVQQGRDGRISVTHLRDSRNAGIVTASKQISTVFLKDGNPSLSLDLCFG